MSVIDIIYDKRFMKNKFKGYTVVISSEKFSEIFKHNPRYTWNYETYFVLRQSVTDWLKARGPYRHSNPIGSDSYTEISFSRENTALEFKLTFL